MNKNELVSMMAQQTGLTKKAAELALNAFTSTIESAMKQNEKVVLVDFGTWKPARRNARKGVNPQTGQQINIPAKTVTVFSAGKEFKSRIENVKRKK